ncbi:Calcium-dependent protein kinase 3 [Bulinus truncatus]|nr:Calcium-dependent protein kinase 3 [Bulinus truncatus]
MSTWLQSCLFVTGIVLLAEGIRQSTFLDKVAIDTSHHGNNFQNTFFNRQIRSATGGVPCVTVPFLTELKERFVRWLDHNNDGQSTFDEVKNYIRRFKADVTDADVAAFIRRRDSNGNGAIDFVPEYIHDMAAPDNTLEGAKEWFHLQDTNDDGFVTEPELVKVAEAVGMSPDEALETVQGYYMSADQDKDGKLTIDEFKTLYTP